MRFKVSKAKMKSGTRKPFNHKNHNTATPSTIEEEVENVEYLDDCATDDADEANGESAPQPPNDVETVFEDTFYPNAVQCLISLYRDKYNQQINHQAEIENIHKSIWKDISKDMRESYFEFDVDQVRLKYTQLRRQYFSVSSRMEAEKFEYFHHFHEMYNDQVISDILNGDSISHKNQSVRSYHDDDLFALPCETEIHKVDKRRDMIDIAHKQNEFMDIVERELKAFGDETSNKRESPDFKDVEILIRAPKRSKIENIALESAEVMDTKAKLEVSNVSKDDMTLAAYNEAQQRRHEEKMQLLRQTLLLQERAINVQSKLLEQIIKRV